jgi:O-antigen ligase
LWSLLAALVALSIGLFVTSAPYAGAISDAGLTGYKAYNSVSVSIAVLSSYLMGLWFDGVGNRKWRNAAGIALVLAPLSVLWTASSSAHGRGGWLALAAGCGYLIWNRLRAVSQSKAFKAVGVTVLIAGMIITAYRIAPNFRYLADETISSNSDDAASAASYAAVDDGGRISTWTHELPKLVDSPVLGTGFFHRGGTSGLWDSGSHNFFIQMFLETGLVGGICILAIFRRMWREAGCVAAREAKLTVATRSALVAAVVAGMSGEYFYGGIEVLVLLAVFAYAGSLPIVGRRQVAFGQRKPVRTFRGPGQSQPRTLQC